MAEKKKISTAAIGERMILRFSFGRATELAAQGFKPGSGFSLGVAFEKAARNYIAEDDYEPLWARYTPSFDNGDGLYELPPRYHGNMKVAIVGVMPLTADGELAFLNMFLLEDANEAAKKVDLRSAKLADLSILKAGVFVQGIYDFSMQQGEVMLLAIGSNKEQKFPLVRTRSFQGWGITAIPELPTLKRYFDPETQNFVPKSTVWEEDDLEEMSGDEEFDETPGETVAGITEVAQDSSDAVQAMIAGLGSIPGMVVENNDDGNSGNDGATNNAIVVESAAAES